MKIRTRLSLLYTLITAVVFWISMFSIFKLTEHNRERSFYRDLKKEAITKAHLFLQNSISTQTMQSIYANNKIFIDEVEVAIYTPNFKMLYNDAHDHDIIYETPQLIQKVLDEKEVYFHVGKYQALAILYIFHKKAYIVTAAAYDGYGIENQNDLAELLIFISFFGLSILFGIGFLLARSSLNPVKEIVRKVETITAADTSSRLPIKNKCDELGELSIAFNDMLERIDKAFSSQKMFISNVSHELRTPLSALIAQLELTTMRNRSNKEYQQAIENALEDSYKLVRLIQGLLDLAKADYFPSQIKYENVRLDELILDAREIILKANPNYHISIIFDQEYEDEKLLTVYGNRYLLTTAFRNLIENNCKFSENHHATIHISSWKENAIIRFSDRGIGISEDDLEKLFLPFFRGNNKRFAQGYGIGMALVKKIVDIHQGSITIHSTKGEGTTFIMSLAHI